MSFLGPVPPSSMSSGLPRGELLGNYPSFDAAQATVQKLVDEGISLQALTVVGRDVRVVNRLRRRAGYPAVVLRSAIQGAFFGLLIGLLMSFIVPETAGLQILSSVALGIGIWVIFGVLGQMMRKKAPGFDTVPQVVAVSYDLVCDFEVSHRARGVLGGQPSQPAPAQPEAAPVSTGDAPQETTPSRRGQIPDLPDGRPQYGVRVDPEEPTASPDESR